MNNRMEQEYYSNQPGMVLFEITTKCNLSCVYCTARRLIKQPADLPLEDIKRIAVQLKPFPYVCLCGLGEALMHKEFYQVLEILQDKKIVLVTNGSIPIDYVRLTKYKNIDAISFSIDGTDEEEMKRISSNYRFDILLDNLMKSLIYGVNTAINCTLVKENIDNIWKLKDLAIKYQVKKFKIGFPLGDSRWVVDHVDQIREVLCKLKAGIEEKGIEFEGPTQIKCIFEGAPIAVVSKNGNTYPCCDYFCGRPLVGNLLHHQFDTMWERESYHIFRTGKYCSQCTQYHRKSKVKELYQGI